MKTHTSPADLAPPRRHLPAGMISDHAAGLLSPGLGLLVASHFTCCPCCRTKGARLEALGGALLCRAAPVAPGPTCLESALSRIDAAERSEPCFDAEGWPLPRPICRCLGVPIRNLSFTPIAPGVEAARLDGFPGEKVEIRQAVSGSPIMGYDEEAAGLLLSGEVLVCDEAYGPGDCLIGLPAAPEASGSGACLCLVVEMHAG